MVRLFSSRVTNCQKYCSAVVSTSFSTSCSCNLLTSSPTFASRLPFTICPPANTGCVALTLAMTPFFIIEKLIGLLREANISGGSCCASAIPNSGLIYCDGTTSISAMPLLALNQAPVALTMGKNLVNASLRCSWAASMSSCPLRRALLWLRAESSNCSRVYVACAQVCIAMTQQMAATSIFFIQDRV